MRRENFLFVIIILFSFGILARLYFWQVINYEKFKAAAEAQHLTLTQISPRRGEIKTSDNFSIVSNEPAFLVYASPSELKKKGLEEKISFPEAVKKTIDAILPFILEERFREASSSAEVIEKDEIVKEVQNDLKERLSNDRLDWVVLKHKMSKDLAEGIREKKISWVGLEKEDRRFYPEASLSAHTVGFVGSDDVGRNKGYFGLEGYYDRELKGRIGKVKAEVDASGNIILVGEKGGIPKTDGRDLLTTIDRTIQYILEKKLAEGLQKYGAKAATAIVLDPKSGAVLALANLPNYEPQRWKAYPQELFKNPAVADTYEPGSTFKIITFAAALNENLIKPETRCECKEPLQIGGFTIRTWNNQYHPDSTMTQVLQHSDNIGAAQISRSLGVSKFLRYIKNFGFGEITGIDLQEEATGIVKEKKDWKEIDSVTASFGQGLSVTALQMARAVAAIANAGKLMKPYIVQKIEGSDKSVEIGSKMERQVIKPEAAKILTEMMVAAVEGGEAKKLIPKGYRIAGKTGTAQIPIAGHYDPKKTVASFVGFGPTENPKFVILVRYTEPSSSPFGAETAAPTFFEITKELFNYYKIAPSK